MRRPLKRSANSSALSQSDLPFRGHFRQIAGCRKSFCHDHTLGLNPPPLRSHLSSASKPLTRGVALLDRRSLVGSIRGGRREEEEESTCVVVPQK